MHRSFALFRATTACSQKDNSPVKLAESIEHELNFGELGKWLYRYAQNYQTYNVLRANLNFTVWREKVSMAKQCESLFPLCACWMAINFV